MSDTVRCSTCRTSSLAMMEGLSMAVNPVCGWCGHLIEGERASDPRGSVSGDEQRVCHPACVEPFRTALAKQREQTVSCVLSACKRVRDAYHDFGPVDDGRPEGDEF